MKSKAPENSFTLSIHAQPDDIDDLDHVNNVVYLQWVQDVATAHWDQVASAEMKSKYSWVVLRHEIDYRNPALLGDELIARTWVSACEGVRSVRNVEFYQSGNGKLIAETKQPGVCLMHKRCGPGELNRISFRFSVDPLRGSRATTVGEGSKWWHDFSKRSL